MIFIDLCTLLLIIFVAIGLTALLVFIKVLRASTSQHPVIIRHYEEFYFCDSPNLNNEQKFPDLTKDDPTLELSVIVPAYNEEDRLPPMLDQCLEYLIAKQKDDKDFTFEVIIVDDGSKDSTTEVGWKYSAKYGADKVRVLTLIKNRGKGGAVRLGMLSARGKWLLFADADGATYFPHFQKLEDVMKVLENTSNYCVVIGSRAQFEKDNLAKRSLRRRMLMKRFNFLVRMLGIRGIRDTQCGFKLLTRPAARKIFSSLHVEGWAFDVEILYIAQSLNFTIAEVAVQWTEIEGSKAVPSTTYPQMRRDFLKIWFYYAIGAWTIAAASQEVKHQSQHEHSA